MPDSAIIGFMPLVAIDSNIVDLFVGCMPTADHVQAAESHEFPPDLDERDSKIRRELFACFWLLSLGPVWTSTLYTFSDKLYAEVARAPAAPLLLESAVEVRENHPSEYRAVDPDRCPSIADVEALGLSLSDAEHVSDAVGMSCDVFLTNDTRLRNRSPRIEKLSGLRLRRPSEFLVEAVREGAPWPTNVPWPWLISALLRD